MEKQQQITKEIITLNIYTHPIITKSKIELEQIKNWSTKRQYNKNQKLAFFLHKKYKVCRCKCAHAHCNT
jgi:hypothetical protein